MKPILTLTLPLLLSTLFFTGTSSVESLEKMEVRSAASAETSLNRYARRVQDRVYRNWQTPASLEDYNDELETAEVSFWVLHDGRILGAKVLRSTGEEELDDLALQAVERSKPLPKFPDDLKERNSMKVSIRFRYVANR